MRRLALIAMLLSAPPVAAAQAPVGDAAEEAATPEERPPQAEAPTEEAEGTDEDGTYVAPAARRGQTPTPEEALPNEPVDIAFVPAPENVPPDEDEAPIYESWWFWLAIGSVVIGVTLAIVVDVTTDDPAPSPRAPVDDDSMGLVLRF